MLIAIALLAAAPPSYLFEISPADAAGTAPDRATGIELIENAVRRILKDPDSAKFEWPNGFVYNSYREPFAQRVTGWFTCGTVNAKNGYGGYTGKVAVLAAISNGSVVKIKVDDPGYGVVSGYCSKLRVPVAS